MAVPNISAVELMEYAKRVFPSDTITHIPMNPDYGSWRLEIGGRQDARWLEFMWGPQSGFGATDVRNLPKDDPDIFAPYEVALSSLEDAKRWLDQKARRPIKTTTANDLHTD